MTHILSRPYCVEAWTNAWLQADCLFNNTFTDQKPCSANIIGMPHEHHGISNHQCSNCLFNSFFRIKMKKTSKLSIPGSFCRESTDDWWTPSPHKAPVMWKVFPCHNIIMIEADPGDQQDQWLDHSPWMITSWNSVMWSQILISRLFVKLGQRDRVYSMLPSQTRMASKIQVNIGSRNGLVQQ